MEWIKSHTNAQREDATANEVVDGGNKTSYYSRDFTSPPDSNKNLYLSGGCRTAINLTRFKCACALLIIYKSMADVERGQV